MLGSATFSNLVDRQSTRIVFFFLLSRDYNQIVSMQETPPGLLPPPAETVSVCNRARCGHAETPSGAAIMLPVHD